MKSAAGFLLLVFFGISTVSRAQTCPEYTAGSIDTTEGSSTTVSAIYVNNRNSEAAPCTGTVYAWHYCYYDENSDSNLEAAFGAFSFSNNVYTLRDGSYHLLHLDTRQTAFTCDTLTLDPSEYFQIQEGDRVGACLRHNGDIDYLDILKDTPFLIGPFYVHIWSQGDGGCAASDMTTSTTIHGLFNLRSNLLHLYVDINIDECTLNEDDCSEFATCSDIVGGEGSFQCTCNIGYSGDGTACNNIDECSTDTHNCAHQATCTDTEGSFSCTCNTGYSGDGRNCNNIDECSAGAHSCAQQATCADTDGSFLCTCNTGYTGNGTGCIDIDECASNVSNCAEQATCTDFEGSFLCTCNTGYTGNGFDCSYIDECDGDNSCDENAECTNSVGTYSCVCLPGYSGDGMTCFIVCDPSCHANAECTLTGDSTSCVCGVGYSGDGITCDDINECDMGLCSGNADCDNTVGSYTCQCQSGFSGDGETCSDIDECTDETDSCDDNSMCTNTMGSYSCSCLFGYSGDGEMCIDVNECLETENVCSNFASCANTNGSYMCHCHLGYNMGDGINCMDIDECGSTGVCGSGGMCQNSVGSYFCSCTDGYVLEDNFCTDMDECRQESTEPLCQDNSKCINVEGSYMCRCVDGYSGEICADINECEEGSYSCGDNAACNNTDGSYSCSCLPGFSGDGQMCSDIDECGHDSNNNCAVNAMCNNTFGSFNCRCLSGYDGDGVSCIDIDECERGSYSCDENADCYNNDGSYTCTCKQGYTENGNLCSDVDECTESPVVCAGAESCENTRGSYHCQCRAGYAWNGNSCGDVDECSMGVSNECSPVSECVNTIGSYSCQCTPGYRGNGSYCLDINECYEHSYDCHQNANCSNTDGGYECHCSGGYTGNGTECEAVPEVSGPERQRGSESGPGIGLVVGVVVAGLLLVVVVLLVVGVLCAFKIRLRSKSVCLPTSADPGFDNVIYGASNGSIQMGSIRKQPNNGGPLQNCSSATDENELRVLENPMYNGIPAHGEEESHLSSVYDTPMEKQTYSVQSCVESNVYDYASLPQGGCPQNGNGAPLECYSAVDYYSTLNEYSYMEQDYDDIIKKAERCGGAVEEDSTNLYYRPAEREDELYQQLQKQRIKSIPGSHIKKLGVLGSGEFGTVCKGQWVYADKKLDVAIKVLSDASNETSKVKFLQEAAIMSQFRHPNVIKLYGVVSDGREIMLIVELLEKGDLRQALNKMRPDPGQLHAVDLPLTLLAFSRQTALGMVYLSGKGFVHRDIAARNILLSHNNICKISDFGMSRDLEDENYYMSQGGKVPVKWTAPEALAYKKYSTASDVWSYGCLLYEIWSLGHKPFEGYTNREVVQQLQTGYRLPPPPGCPEAIYNLMIDCWNPDPAERPNFQQILLTLLGDDKALLAVPTEEKASHSLAGVLGSPLEAGHCMYCSRQNSYLTT